MTEVKLKEMKPLRDCLPAFDFECMSKEGYVDWSKGFGTDDTAGEDLVKELKRCHNDWGPVYYNNLKNISCVINSIKEAFKDFDCIVEKPAKNAQGFRPHKNYYNNLHNKILQEVQRISDSQSVDVTIIEQREVNFKFKSLTLNYHKWLAKFTTYLHETFKTYLDIIENHYKNRFEYAMSDFLDQSCKFFEELDYELGRTEMKCFKDALNEFSKYRS